MSQTLAAAATRRVPPRPQAGRSTGRSPLRVVRPPSPERGRTLFAACCLSLLIGGLLALLMVNTSLGQGSFRLHELQATTGQLGDREQALQQDVDRQASPERLARRAGALGMVPAGTPAFLRLADGRVFGVAMPPKPDAEARVPKVKVTRSSQTGAQQKPTAGRD